MIRFPRLAVLLLCLPLAATELLVAAPAAAAAPVRYVSLGDSYSSGVGAGDYDPASGLCRRSRRAYPPLWVHKQGSTVSRAAYLACSGATTVSLLRDQVPRMPTDTTLVTVSIGGNDIGFGVVITTCLLNLDTVCSKAVDRAIEMIHGTLPGRLDRSYAEIQHRAPGARLVVLGYPRLYELNMLCASGVSAVKRRRLNEAADLLAEVTAARAAAADATFVDVRTNFTGHGLCGRPAWLNGLIDGAVVDSYHPDRLGYAHGYLPALLTTAP